MTKITGKDHIRVIKLLYLNLSCKCSKIYIERNVFMCTMKKKNVENGKVLQSLILFVIVSVKRQAVSCTCFSAVA